MEQETPTSPQTNSQPANASLLKKAETFLYLMVTAGVIFKLMNWPMASSILVLSLCSLASIFFLGNIFLTNRVSVRALLQKQSEKPKTIGLVIGGFAGIAFAVGSIALLFGIEQWPNWHSLITIAIPGCVLFALIGTAFMAKKENVFGLPIMKRGIVLGVGCFLVLLFHVKIEAGRYGYMKEVFLEIHACAEKGNSECKEDLLLWRESMSAPGPADPSRGQTAAGLAIEELTSKYGFETYYPDGEMGPAEIRKVE